MASRNPGRLLFLSVNHDGKILGYAASPESRISKEFHSLTNLDKIGVFDTILLSKVVNNKERLIDELRRINQKGWIDSKRLDANGNVLDCNSSNCGGYTLEAELGIRPNGFSEPDYLGWEVKQFAVPAFDRINTGIITLMTPEPTGGIYVKSGVKDFISKYGYEDLRGRLNRKNFGGVHKVNIKHNRTSLTLMLPGFDHEKCKITDAGGSISLVDVNGNIAAEWSFSSMIKHWNRKHNQACYVPSRSLVSEMRKYYYGNKIILGEETDFQFFLKEMAVGNIYYDPGIKMEEIDGKIKVKRRSQFRIKSINLGNLYKQTATTLL